MNAESDPRTSGRIQELDGWRAVSVLLVILGHIITYKQVNLHSGALERMVFFGGHLGVSVFFVISGFVICRLFILEEKRFGSVLLRGFYYRRIFRILPPLFTFLAVIALMMSVGLIRGSWEALPFAATFFSDLEPIPRNWFVGHTWSLSVEEQFYLVFPAMWVLTPARWRSGAVTATFLLCVGSSLAFTPPLSGLTIEMVARWGFVAISVGVWAAIHEQWVRQAAARVPAICIGLVALILLTRPVHRDNHFGYQLFNAAFLPLGIGLILMYSLERGRWLRAALCSKPMQAIGITSYGIYLWQQIFNAQLADYTPRGVAIGYMLPLMLIVIPLSYFFLEKPAMRFGKTLSGRARENACVRAGASA
jgi:peptidoglycan/LPS O-acetylase OafA/YrhL